MSLTLLVSASIRIRSTRLSTGERVSWRLLASRSSLPIGSSEVLAATLRSMPAKREFSRSLARACISVPVMVGGTDRARGSPLVGPEIGTELGLEGLGADRSRSPSAGGVSSHYIECRRLSLWWVGTSGRLRRVAEVRASAACGGVARRSNMTESKRMSCKHERRPHPGRRCR